MEEATTQLMSEDGVSPRLRSRSMSTVSQLSQQSAAAQSTNSTSNTSSNLHQLARDGDLKRISEVLASQESARDNMNELDAKENSPLHYACRYTHLKVVNRLLDFKGKIKVDRDGSDKMTPLHYASRYGKNVTERTVQGTSSPQGEDGVLVVEALLQAGADINRRDVYDLTPLHHAALRGNIRVVKCLVSQKSVAKIEIDPEDSFQNTPLHVAATYDNSNVVKLLLKNGADVTKVDQGGQNVLHKAAREGNNKVVVAVIEHLKPRKDDDDEQVKQKEEKLRKLMSQPDKRGNYPFMLAVQSVTSGKTLETFMENANSAGYVNTLLETPNKRNEFPIHKACRSGDKRTAEILVKHGANVNKLNSFNESPLFFAADYSDNTDLVQFLVEKGAYLDQMTLSGWTPIMVAASQGHIDTVKYLASKCAELDLKDKNDQTIIHLAAQNNQDAVIEEILNLESTPTDFMVNENDQLDNTPLHLACAAGFLDTVKVLIEHEAQVDNKNEDEKTPFHMAAENGHVEVVEYILSKDKNAKNDCDEDDNTGLHLAASNKMTNTVELLIESGSDVRKRNNREWTPLDCAAAAGSFKCVLKILEAGADVDPMDKKGITPLHLTAIHGHPQVTRLLLEHGARIEIENDDGKNALELAIESDHKAVAEAILSSEHWKMAMTSSSVSPGGWLDTPLRMLIRKFPELAAKVLDNCITKDKDKDKVDANNNIIRSGMSSKTNKVEYRFDYTFLEDTFNYKAKERKFDENWDLKLRSVRTVGQEELGSTGMSEYKGSLRFQFSPDSDKPYDKDSLVIQNNHPLMIMVKQQQKTLMKHPLCLALLRHKWKKFQYIFYFYVLFYLVYLGLITTFVLMDLDLMSSNHTKALRWPIFIYICFGLVLELFDFYRMRLAYFNIDNLVDLSLYGLSVFYIAWSHGCAPQEDCWSLPLGSLLVTCAWLNLTSYLTQLPFEIGIYIVMFLEILRTVAKLGLLLLIFIVAFGLGFHIVLHNDAAAPESGFEDNAFWSFLKTFVMMVGEMDYGDFMDGPWRDYVAVLFIIFVVLMTIIMMNLITGLALDDIQKIAENAEYKKLAMQVELVLGLERLSKSVLFFTSKDIFKVREKLYTTEESTSSLPFFKKNYLSWQYIISLITDEKHDSDDNSLDLMIRKQKELKKIISDLTSKVETLHEEFSEFRSTFKTNKMRKYNKGNN